MISEKEVQFTDKADYMMKKAIDFLFDAKINGPCRNRVWYDHITKLIDDAMKNLEELHNGWEASE